MSEPWNVREWFAVGLLALMTTAVGAFSALVVV